MLYTTGDLLAIGATVVVICLLLGIAEYQRRSDRAARARARAAGRGPYEQTAALPRVDLDAAAREHAALLWPDVSPTLAYSLLQLRRLGVGLRIVPQLRAVRDA